MALSKISIIGNLGRDPELRYTPNGRPVASFTVAVNQSTKNQQSGEWIESTDWFRVSVWGDRGERAAESLRKGSRVFVDGRFRTREYEANDGQKRLSLDITADTVLGLDKRETADGTELDELEDGELPSGLDEEEHDRDVPEFIGEDESDAAPAAID